MGDPFSNIWKFWINKYWWGSELNILELTALLTAASFNHHLLSIFFKNLNMV
jgi:hypothetical protein